MAHPPGDPSLRPDRRRRLGFAGALALLTLVSLVWAVAFTLWTKGGDDDLLDEGDAFYYGLTAANAANGNWFQDPFTLAPAADHPPLTILVLTPVSYLFDGPMAQRLTMSVIGAMTVAAVGLLGRQVGGPRVGLVAAALAAVNANLWVNHALVMSEALTGLLVTLLLAMAYRLVRRPTPLVAVATGVIGGLAVLTRAETALLFMLLVVPIVARAGQLTWGQRLARLAVAACGSAVVLAPWVVWVNTQFERPVVVSTNEGLTLAGANCDETYYSENIGFWSIDCSLALLDDDLDASENSAALRREALDYARDNLGRLPLVAVAREGRLLGYWRPDLVVDAGEAEGRPAWASWLGLVTFWLLLPAAIVGARALHRRHVTIWPFVAVLISTVVVTLLFSGIPRQRLGLDIVTCVLVAAAVVGWRWPASLDAGARSAQRVA
jgi:4-amino-4-deoxy-L-arabinose transferase-like glycosyltransferase